jgi:hypothetical protein
MSTEREMIVTEKAHGRTRFFLGTVEQLDREWDHFTADRSKAKSMTESEARAKAEALNQKHAEHAQWCKFGVVIR